MADRDFLQWPFLDAAHREFAARVEAFAAGLPAHHGDADAATRGIAHALGEAGLLEAAVPPDGRLEVRKLCLARDILARHSGLADFAFAMQGLGTGAITLFGSEALKARVLPGVRAGTTLAAFALSEPEAGSDVAAMATTAQRDGEGWVLTGKRLGSAMAASPAPMSSSPVRARHQGPRASPASGCRARRCGWWSASRRRRRTRWRGWRWMR